MQTGASAQGNSVAPALYPFLENGLWGYIDSTASWVIAPQYNAADSFADGLALVEKDGKRMYIRHDGSMVWKEP